MFSMPIKVNFDGGECCWEEEEEEEELCCGRAGGGKAGSPFKEGSFVGFLLWVSGSSHFFFFLFLFSILLSWCFAVGLRSHDRLTGKK